MKILYISHYFYPEMGAASARAFELSKYWVEYGHEVTVLTCFPNYPDGVIHNEYKRKFKKLFMREQICGVNIIRAATYPTHLRSSSRRGLNYLSFFISSAIITPFLKNFDVIIATSPPLFPGLTGLIASRLKNIPLVFEVRDLWPEVITAVGAAGKNSLSYKTFDKIASILYEKSNLIVALTESFKDEIISQRGVNRQRIKVIENGVDIKIFKPFPAELDLIDKIGLKDRFIISYIGTIGYTHGVEVIVRAAHEVKRKFPQIAFLLVGDGSDKTRLEKLKNEEGLDNVVFAGQQPKQKIPVYLNASNISLVLSSKQRLFRKTIFAKVFEPMACGVPVIVGAEGETRNIVVNRANAGIGFEPENACGLTDSITKLYNNPELRKKLGENGREFVRREFSRSAKAKQYSDILEELVRNNRR
ncbi:MAG: glycosyltransferase family 4 protein [Deltaproteobacteria bacterium]